MPGKATPVRVEQAWKSFQKYLLEKEHRITQPRRIVCEHVFSRKDHFTAEEVSTALSVSGPTRVSRGTVYQTLSLMVKAGMAREIRDTGQHAYYERTFGHQHHEHMVCERCGAFIEFLDPEICRRISAACRSKGFRQRTHRVTVLGICKTCHDNESDASCSK
jgi:Fur family ferric uptake transcriptional regulator